MEKHVQFLADHESSMKHIRAIGAWIELENRLKEGKTIDKESQLMQKETQQSALEQCFTKNHFNCAVSCSFLQNLALWMDCFNQTMEILRDWSNR